MVKEKETEELEFQRFWKRYDFPDVLRCLREYWTMYRGYSRLCGWIRDRKDPVLLDVGCGVISVLELLREDFPDCTLVGIDPLMSDYRRLYDLNPSIQWTEGYAESFPYGDESFDLVVSSNTLDHVEDLRASLDEIVRVLPSGGRFYATMDIFTPHATRHMDRGEAHPHTLSPGDFRSVIEEAGFDVVRDEISRSVPSSVSNYLEKRIDEGWSRTGVRALLNPYHGLQSWIKQILNRGALGEAVVMARKP